MIENKKHRVELNLPAFGVGGLPDPTKAPVTVDGLPFPRVKSLQVYADAGRETHVVLEFYAEIIGATDVPADNLEKRPL